MNIRKGYWEYKVINIRDKLGGIDIEKLNTQLNNIGKDNWHLVTAFTNELGKNALSLGGIGVNSTIDQNILIFERYIDLEGEEKRKIEETAINKLAFEAEEKIKLEKELLLRDKTGKAKTIDDLLLIDEINKEANTIKRLYGEARYNHFLKVTAREYGIILEE